MSKITAGSFRGGRKGIRVWRDGEAIVEYHAPVNMRQLKDTKRSDHLEAIWLLCFFEGVTWEEFVELFSIDENYMWDTLTPAFERK